MSSEVLREAVRYIAALKDVLDPEDQIRGVEKTGLEAWAREILAKKGLPSDPAVTYDKRTGKVWDSQPDGAMCGLLPLIRHNGFEENSVEDLAARILIQLDLLSKEVMYLDARSTQRLIEGLLDLLKGKER